MAEKTHRLLGFTNAWWFTIILMVILMVIFHLSKFVWFGDRFCLALSVVDPEIPNTSSSISITECLDLKDHWVFFHRCPIRMVRIDPLGPPKCSETFLETQGPRRNRGLWMWGMLHIGRDYIWTHLGMLMISHIWRSDPSNQTKQSGSIWHGPNLKSLGFQIQHKINQSFWYPWRKTSKNPMSATKQWCLHGLRKLSNLSGDWFSAVELNRFRLI